jgi:phosphohistidine phosphatase SixA
VPRLRLRGVKFDKVFTSQWCRCRETAALIEMGAVEALPSLNSFFAGQGDRVGQTAATLAALSASEGRVAFALVRVKVALAQADRLA